MPGFFEKVSRAEHIKVKALNRDGESFEMEARDLLAVCIQHEMDHLGKLFVDYLSAFKRNRIKTSWKNPPPTRPLGKPMKIVLQVRRNLRYPRCKPLLDSPFEVCAVYTQPDRPAGRGRKHAASPVKQLAQAHEIPVYQPENFKQTESLTDLATLNPDLLVVVAYGLILPQSVLDIPRLGCINVHGSLLPRWRGAAPIHRALMAGDEKTGITIMKW